MLRIRVTYTNYSGHYRTTFFNAFSSEGVTRYPPGYPLKQTTVSLILTSISFSTVVGEPVRDKGGSSPSEDDGRLGDLSFCLTVELKDRTFNRQRFLFSWEFIKL